MRDRPPAIPADRRPGATPADEALEFPPYLVYFGIPPYLATIVLTFIDPMAVVALLTCLGVMVITMKLLFRLDK